MFFYLFLVLRGFDPRVKNVSPSRRTLLRAVVFLSFFVGSPALRAVEPAAVSPQNATSTAASARALSDLEKVAQEIQANEAERARILHELEYGDAAVETLRKQVKALEGELLAKRKLLADTLMAHPKYKACDEKRRELFRRMEEIKQREGILVRPLADEAARQAAKGAAVAAP